MSTRFDVSRIMIRDGRTLDHKTLEEIRRMAVERVREGEEPSAVIASYGFCRTTIYKWLKKASGRGRGLRALRSRKGTGRPPKLMLAMLPPERNTKRWRFSDRVRPLPGGLL